MIGKIYPIFLTNQYTKGAKTIIIIRSRTYHRGTSIGVRKSPLSVGRTKIPRVLSQNVKAMEDNEMLMLAPLAFGKNLAKQGMNIKLAKAITEIVFHSK